MLAAFAAVYLIWGSTYLAIRFAIESIPPFLMAGVRFLVAGGVLFVFARVRGAAAPQRLHWRTAIVVGGLLLLGGNGGVVWAEQYVPSGIAALLVATVPLWITSFEWLATKRRAPNVAIGGVLVGFAGVALLIGPGALGDGPGVSMPGAAALLLASLLWSGGSLYSRTAPQPGVQTLATAMSMIAGGILLLGASVVTGEPARFDLGTVTMKSVMALLYLIVFGALIAYTAFMWLMRVTTPARAATYAYVNPVVAVVLGWVLGGEAMNSRMIVAAAIIVGSVALTISSKASTVRSVSASAADAHGPETDPEFAGDLPKPAGVARARTKR